MLTTTLPAAEQVSGGMMQNSGMMGTGMMIGMGLIWLLVVVILIGAVAALWKYLRSDKKRDE